jgi:Delta3-Delta2-enoyl-CoA isomerase
MLKNYNIGLNESVVGIVPPQFVNAVTRSALSTRQGEIALTSGALYSAEDALKLGMVDEISNDENEGIEKATKFLESQMKIPAHARGLVKQSYRKPELDLVRDPKARARDSKIFIDHIMRPATQKVLIEYVESLKNKKK